MAKNQSWASDDDASDLLAGILNETEEEARAEQERIEAELRAREAEERRQKEAEEARLLAEANARITAEMDRQEGLEKRRTMRMEALRVEELKERGEWVDPAIKAAEAEAARKAEEARIAREAAQQAALLLAQQQQAAAAQAQPVVAATPAPNKSNTPIYILAAVALLVLGLGGGLFALTQNSYEVDNKTYAKAVYQPKDPEIKLVTMGFTPLPKVEEKPVQEDKPAARPSTRPRPRPTPSRPAADNKKSDKKPGLKLDLSGTDPFGAGF